MLETLKKIWDFIWNSDSVWSWLVNIVLAFIFIKFIFYPGLGALFGTSFPLVAVVSGSMEHMIISHNDNVPPHLCGKSFDRTDLIVSLDDFWWICGDWYEQRNISKQEFSRYLFPDGFNKGDIIVLYGQDPKNIKIGDVIVFQRNRQYPIIHRVIDIKDTNGKLEFTTKGDHNGGMGIDDLRISEDIVLGTGVFRVPLLGWVKIWFDNLITLAIR